MISLKVSSHLMVGKMLYYTWL